MTAEAEWENNKHRHQLCRHSNNMSETAVAVEWAELGVPAVAAREVVMAREVNREI